MLKILQVSFKSMWTMNFQMFKLDLEKADEPEIKLPISVGSLKKAGEFQKNICFCFIDYAKAFDCVDHNKLENSERGEYQITLPASWKTCMQVKKQQLELDMDWFKIGKGIWQGCILSPCLFNCYAEYIMRNARWMK